MGEFAQKTFANRECTFVTGNPHKEKQNVKRGARVQVYPYLHVRHIRTSSSRYFGRWT